VAGFQQQPGDRNSGAGIISDRMRIPMTKHVSPEITGTELIGTDYIKPDDGAIMRETEPGRFEAKRDNSRTVSEDTGPVIGDMESFDDTKESPKRIALKFMQSELEGIFD
jgi:hypothetical protein